MPTNTTDSLEPRKVDAEHGGEDRPARAAHTRALARQGDDGEPDAARSEVDERRQGMHGMTLEHEEIAGGNVARELTAPQDDAASREPLTRERRALQSRVGQKLAGFIGRPVSEWGLIGEGDTIKGHMLLLDLDTGDKVRAYDSHIVGKGKLYLNLRNVPQALADGDTIDQVLGA
jgi:hypothetical protein